MFAIFLDRIGDVAVLQPDGRFVQADAVLALRCAVTSQGKARAIVLDLSEVEALEDRGLKRLASAVQGHHISKHLDRISKIASVRAQSVLSGLTTKNGLQNFPLGRHPIRANAVCIELQRRLHVRMPQEKRLHRLWSVFERTAGPGEHLGRDQR